jgi:hypothetical protein
MDKTKSTRIRKLTLSKRTVRLLTTKDLKTVEGGATCRNGSIISQTGGRNGPGTNPTC